MNFKELLDLEYAIADNYNKLYEAERYPNINKTKNITEKLIPLLEREDQIIYNYTLEEIKQARKELVDIRPFILPLNYYLNNLYKRIDSKLNDIIETETYVNGKGRKLEKPNLLMKLVNYEKADVFLSFLDERLASPNNNIDKDLILIYKYIIISELETDNVKRISKRNYRTEKSVYLDSLLYTANHNYKNEDYLDFKDFVTLNDIVFINDSILNMPEKKNNGDLDLTLRTAMTLLTLDTYNNVKTFLLNNKSLLEKYISLFGSDILETFDKDRQRHKILYLKK